MKKIMIFCLLAALCISLAACKNQEDGQEAETTPVETTDEQAEPESSEPAYINPLTGLGIDEDIAGDRPCVIMINNLEAALPQQGVGSADIIYEVPVEGGITRMLAVFQDVSDVGVIGSVRSVRPYYLDLVQGLDGILIHAGGSDQAYSEIRSRGIDNIDGVNGSGEIFYRDSERRAMGLDTEHTLVTSSDLILEYLPIYDISLEHEAGYTYEMDFISDGGSRSGGLPAETAKIVFSTYKTGVFEYDSADGRYYVSQFGESYTDGNTGKQVSVKNVLVLFAEISQIAGDEKGRLQAELMGSGSGYFICDGEYYTITWTKESSTAQLRYTMEDGRPVEFGQGTSYVNIVPVGSAVDFS